MKYLIVSSLFKKTQKITLQSSSILVLARQFKLLLLVALLQSTSVQAITITTSIPPLAGMIAPLLSADDEIKVILKAGQSPHSFQMSPANMQQLIDSDLVVWVGTPVDGWLKKPLHSTKAINLAMHDLKELKQFPVRHGGIWEKHLHRDKQHSTEDNGHHEHQHHADNHHDEKEGSHKKTPANISQPRMDGHLWMSYQNAVLLIEAVSVKLQQLKPNQANDIQQKTTNWLNKLKETDSKVETQLRVVKQQPYLVLHDAFQYFEARYALNGVGSIQLNPTVSPSLKRVSQLRQRIQNGTVKCVFKEPQFPEKRVLSVVRGLDVKVGSLDPIGVLSTSDNNQTSFINYDRFMRQLADQFTRCLQQP